MDTAQIRELASKVRELDRKIDEIRSELQSEVRRLDWKAQTLKTDALTKDHALTAAFIVWFALWCVVILLAAANRH